ncbi:hypothetical protein GQ602_006310 [Ophiocordyceps camponoti-floridani]|uniref:Mid2 domain-containing protein n=1 Tax=Ophiocordyceps camponoti-floridani TaxID=2030778 RepID=A0A8H4VBS1_9HYPO|nr:hypothetical protein GQ602_006310 [Ophiocordyceps camponoti-floridani]
MDDPRDRLGLQCPPTSVFYICKDTPKRFLGCCTIDACQRGGDCPLPNIESATFNASRYQDIPPQECDSASALWYTCKFTRPPFLGCCRQNPCTQTSGCPAGALGVGVLNRDPSLAASLLPMSATTTTTTRRTATPTTSKTPSTTPSGDAGSISKGTAAGISIGVSAALISLLSALVVFLYRRKKRKSSKDDNIRSTTLETSARTSPDQSPSYLNHRVSPMSGCTSPSPPARVS